MLTIMNKENTDTVAIEWQNYGQALGGDVYQFFMSKEYSDVTISTEDGFEIRGHRIILAMCSPYFRDLFKINDAPNQISKYICKEKENWAKEVMFKFKIK